MAVDGLRGMLTWWGGWLPAFVLTCAIELPVYLIMFELCGLTGSGPGGTTTGRRLGRGRAAALVLLLNAVSHPIFWSVALGLPGDRQLLAGELAVVAVEGLIVWLVVRRRPLACLGCALVANAASAVLGSALLETLTASVS